MMIDTLVVATHNQGKLKEFKELLAGMVGEVKSAGDLGLPSPPETGTTFIENAMIKAKAAVEACGLPCLSDDSGLSVNALNGEPGVYAADWAGPEKDFQKAMALINEKLGDATDRSAYFTSVLVLAFPDGRTEVFEGRINGIITWPPRGENGFGYDPMFIPDGYGQTFGELKTHIKNSISHRTMAVNKLRAFLRG